MNLSFERHLGFEDPFWPKEQVLVECHLERFDPSPRLDRMNRLMAR